MDGPLDSNKDWRKMRIVSQFTLTADLKTDLNLIYRWKTKFSFQKAFNPIVSYSRGFTDIQISRLPGLLTKFYWTSFMYVYHFTQESK